MRRALSIAAASLAALSLLFALAIAVAVLAVRYPVERLAPSEAASLSVVDRDGRLLRQLPIAGGGRASWVKLVDVPPALIAATLAGEDARFFSHAGVDPVGLARALFLDVKERRFAFGGSTLPMQLVRLVEPHRRSLWGKLVELVEAMRLSRALSKQEILEQYLNRACYGHGAFGVAAAARLYFDKPARALSDGEAVLLAVLPRAPAGYDPLRHLDAAMARRHHLLGLLVDAQAITEEQRARIEATPIRLARPDEAERSQAARGAFRAPHFVDHVLETLPDEIRRGGGVVVTTLDGALQDRVEAAVRRQVASLDGAHVEDAGAVVLDAATGAVRAMVGSPDYFDAAGAGQVNIITTPRHPGSSLKPFIYALAIEGGDSPASIAWDTADYPSAFRVNVANADHHQHGPVRYRVALACSYNLAAVHVAERVGIGAVLSRLRQAGLTTLEGSAADYGPVLALGGGPHGVRLLDLAAAYAFLIDGGRVLPARVVDHVDRADDLARSPWRPLVAPPRQLFSPETSWLVMDMLADPDARRPAFGDDLPFDLPYPVAAKTGTSSGFSDNVAVIATREFIVAAWAGNFDGSNMHNVLAMQGAAPLARAALLAAADGRTLSLPPRPEGIATRTVCAKTGLLPGPRCPHKREKFLAGSEPRATCAAHPTRYAEVVSR